MCVKGNMDKQDSIKITYTSSSEDENMGRARGRAGGRPLCYVAGEGQLSALGCSPCLVKARGLSAGRLHPASPGSLGFSWRGGQVPRAGLPKVLGSSEPPYFLFVEEVELVRVEPAQIPGRGSEPGRGPQGHSGCEPSLGHPWELQPALQMHQKSSIQ